MVRAVGHKVYPYLLRGVEITRPSRDAPWSTPFPAGLGVNSDADDWEPELAPDGLELFFHSGRPGESGGIDLWVSRRTTRAESFGPAVNLGSGINTAANDACATISSDGLTLLFRRDSESGSAY